MLAPLDIADRPEIFIIKHELADVWIGKDRQSDVTYAYGGTRLIAPQATEQEVEEHLVYLTIFESALKNRLINLCLERDVLAPYRERLPPGFMESRVGGGRCIIRPRDQETYLALKDPQHPDFQACLSMLFQEIGAFLNDQGGTIKLTPDFGRFAGLADILARFTPHSLGIKCEDGGCGGKSSYSSTGVIAAIEELGYAARKEEPVTLIGAAGAMGAGILEYFQQERFQEIAICDLAYDHALPELVAEGLAPPLPSRKGAFTDECLRRGGLLVATTVGQELENSKWQLIPPGTDLLLAHNLAIPQGPAGLQLMREIAAQDVFALPGQVLTLGGALTSRLEWFWRQAYDQRFFDKPLAHLIVRAVVSALVSHIVQKVRLTGSTPYEITLQALHAKNLFFSETD